MRKKALVCLCAALLMLLMALSGCGRGGDVGGVVFVSPPSETFNQREIELAMKEVIRTFEREMDGCTLQELSYDEATNQKHADDWAKQYDADEAIVIGSVFVVPEKDGPITLEPGSTHTWDWVLTRNGSGSWTLQNWGYA